MLETISQPTSASTTAGAISDLIDIAERAMSPDELKGLPCHAPTSGDRKKAEKLLQKWEKLIQAWSKKPDSFAERLASLNLDRTSALERLEKRPRLKPEDLPDWARELGEILNEDRYPPSPMADKLLREIDSTSQLLFPQFLHPFISKYLDDFTSNCPQWQFFLEEQVLQTLVRSLLSQLSFICARTVACDLKQKSTLGLLKGKTPQERYQYYVNEILGTPQGFFELLRRYPVLGRLLATVTAQAVANSVRWFGRLVADYPAITLTFAGGEKPGKVESVGLDLSDPHNGGQTVWSVTFTSGLRLAYKPRSLAIDAAYLQFLEWFNGVQPGLTLRAAPILPREGYGWVLWLNANECESQQEVAQFYRRQGANLAVLYFLCSTDFHEENFIADGPWPIPIDLESIGSAALSFTMAQLAHQLPLPFNILETVVSVGALPRWIPGESVETEAMVIEGIGGRKKVMFPIAKEVWYNLGTDQLKMNYERVWSQEALPLPRFKQQPVELYPWLAELLEGFTKGYRTFLKYRELLLAEESPLSAFKDLLTRVLFRGTDIYKFLLSYSVAPDHLTSGAAYDVALELVSGTQVESYEREDVCDFGRVEKQALWQRDVPYFVGSIGGYEIQSPDGSFSHKMNDVSNYELMQHRIKIASEANLDWQKQMIAGLFKMSSMAPGAPISSSDRLSDRLDELPSPRRVEAALELRIKGHLLALGDNLAQLTLRYPEGVGWLSLAAGNTKMVLLAGHPFPWHPSGAAGVAVFLANLAAYTGDPSWANLAMEASQTVANLVRKESKYLLNRLRYQGLQGFASLTYSLATCAEKLGERSLFDFAYELVMKFTPQEWKEIQNPDVLTGSASNLLSMVYLYERQPSEELLQRARALAGGILLSQETEGECAGGFRIPDAPRPLLGMAHGAAGIAYALSRLYRLTGDPVLASAIGAALAYERSNYNREYQNWPNLGKRDGSLEFLTGWCGGAPGIGLARLEMLDRFDGDLILEEIEAACEATVRHIGTSYHHLCCGEAGRIIFLVRASQKLNRPELLAAAATAAAKMLDFYEQKGFWQLQATATRSIVPGLTDGIAGIGLSLLTLLEPEKTSSFLTLS